MAEEKKTLCNYSYYSDLLWYFRHVFKNSYAGKLFLKIWRQKNLEDIFNAWNVSDSPMKYSLHDIIRSCEEFLSSDYDLISPHTLRGIWSYAISSLDKKNVKIILLSAFRHTNRVYAHGYKNEKPQKYRYYSLSFKQLHSFPTVYLNNGEDSSKYMFIFPPFYAKLFSLKDFAAALANIYFDDSNLIPIFPSAWNRPEYNPLTLNKIAYHNFGGENYNLICNAIKDYIYDIHLQERNKNSEVRISTEEISYVRFAWLSALQELKEMPFSSLCLNSFYNSSYRDIRFPGSKSDIEKIMDLCPQRFDENKLAQKSNELTVSSAKELYKNINSIILKYLPYILYAYITSNLNEPLDDQIEAFKNTSTESSNYRNYKNFIKRTFCISSKAKKRPYWYVEFIIFLFRCCLTACYNKSFSEKVDFTNSSYLFLYSIYHPEKKESDNLFKDKYTLSLTCPNFPKLFWSLLDSDEDSEE